MKANAYKEYASTLYFVSDKDCWRVGKMFGNIINILK